MDRQSSPAAAAAAVTGLVGAHGETIKTNSANGISNAAKMGEEKGRKKEHPPSPSPCELDSLPFFFLSIPPRLANSPQNNRVDSNSGRCWKIFPLLFSLNWKNRKREKIIEGLLPGV